MERGRLRAVLAFAATALIFGGTARAGVPGVIVNSARTVAHGVRDGALTVGRTTRAFVFGGVDAAEDTWDENVELTREHAFRNADRVRAEARGPRYYYDDDVRAEPSPPVYDDLPAEPSPPPYDDAPPPPDDRY
jgi:hypothetical protein